MLDPGRPHPLWPAGVHHLKGDVRDLSTVRRAAAGCGMIFHVAGLWDGGPGGAERMESINVGGTRAVLSVGLPVVYTSSSITCGFGSRAQPGTEDEPSEDPRHPIQGTGARYRQTKLAAERLERGPRRAGALEDVLLLLRELLGALAPLEDVFLAGGASKVLLKEICSYSLKLSLF